MTQSPIEVHPVSAATPPDFLAFFDGEAFADNPEWGFCYCQFAYIDHSKVQWKTRQLDENRAAACQRIQTAAMQGYLAYREGIPIGWCNAAPRTMLDAFLDEPDPDAERIGQITCFIVAKQHRGTGVATALLQAALNGLRALGCPTGQRRITTDAESLSGVAAEDIGEAPECLRQITALPTRTGVAVPTGGKGPAGRCQPGDALGVGARHAPHVANGVDQTAAPICGFDHDLAARCGA